jgi:two-component system, OmpR family, response regulator RpaA
VARILVVDDEPDLVWAVKYALLDEGYEVLTAGDGVQALAIARRERPDLFVLDIAMPGLDGIEVCREARHDLRLASVPILFLSSHDAVRDRVRGLDEGGDDYLCKPFDLTELKARVRALLRRNAGAEDGPSADAHVLRVGELSLDTRDRSVQVDGSPVNLTPAEFGLLGFLMAHPGEVFSSRQLMERVWGYPSDTGDTALVRWHMKNLRSKIEPEPTDPAYIRTVAHQGYILDRRTSSGS